MTLPEEYLTKISSWLLDCSIEEVYWCMFIIGACLYFFTFILMMTEAF